MTAIRGRLHMSCCHFQFLCQADLGQGPDPDSILYGPGPMVNKLLKYLQFWLALPVKWIRKSTDQLHGSSGTPYAFKAINITTLNTDRQKSWKASDRRKDEWAIQAEETERRVTQRQQRKITPHLVSKSWWMFPRSRCIFGQYKKPFTDGDAVQEWKSITLLEGKQKQKCYLKLFILRCTIIKKLFYSFSLF